MEVFLILIHIVLFSSDNVDDKTKLDNKREIENTQTSYMLFLHRFVATLIRFKSHKYCIPELSSSKDPLKFLMHKYFVKSDVFIANKF